MSIDLTSLDKPTTRLLFTVELKPLQGDRFQPTGFPSLGAATYQTKTGAKLLVESAQSMANRMETTCWDVAKSEPISVLSGISHVTVTQKGKFLTDTMLEAHRLNSPYLLESRKNTTFIEKLKVELRCSEVGPTNRTVLAKVLLHYDVGSLLHGVFLAKPELKGGTLRVARALSAFIEASGTRVAASGGVKNDHVHPGKVEGDSKNHFGNIPFPRDEFTADRIDCHVNLDLGQIRGYGLGERAERLLILLALHRVRCLLDGDLRLRTACDLEPVDRASIVANRPSGFPLPSLADLESELRAAIDACKDMMAPSTFAFEDELKTGKDAKKDPGSDGNDVAEADEDDEQG
ncbi:MAG: type I-U CRISPR-associated protein Cas7 [Acidobacteria bacterium RIFCSPLOWO2_12_FULL_67_14]|nr:MAG: type I-U CRISPR-associated protein Cas7 [Acidobacteria bacterium RIFCSPLOWO2_02_FULL_67_21]OFW40476.1 MAG: type I-U CRISPR-associated protein Cas7 [Acidobacteria bacterium RIFCSPLOWO2_12_FULL_67_14]